LPILPIDTGRYGSPEMRGIFEEENKLQRWLDVEAAVAEAQASSETFPKMLRRKSDETLTRDRDLGSRQRDRERDPS